MDYIPHIDELLISPPFLLGSSPPTYRFQSNVFILEADNAQLNALVDQQLNDALPNGPVKYRVPKSVERVFVAFFRYDRAESVPQANMGWMAYTEAMMGFLVLREPNVKKGEEDEYNVPEVVTYLGVVYIDDSAHVGQIEDPHTAPIVLGREAYGLPKAPGQIYYDPHKNYPKQPRLEIWDKDAGTNRLHLTDAIRISPVLQSNLAYTPPPGGPPPPSKCVPGSVPARDDPFPASPYLPLDLQFGLNPGELEVTESSSLLPGVKNAVDVLIPEENVSAVAWNNLLWRTKIVGLKQFPDPQSPYSPAKPNGLSCYRAIVESPIEEVPGNLLGPPDYVLREQIIEFPKLKKGVDLMTSFGIPTAAGRSVEVTLDRMYYQDGVVKFAEPTKVNVWTPT